MSIAVRFVNRLVLWTLILAGFFTLVQLLTGSGLTAAVSSFMVLGGLALVLAAFPAGISVSRDVLPDAPLEIRPVAEFAVASLVVALVVLVLAGWVGPAVVRGAPSVRKGAPVSVDPQAMSLGALRAAAKLAVDRAERGSAESPIKRWQPANILMWHYVRRLAGVAQLVCFAWLGLLAGFWAYRIGRRDLEQAQYWALGLFLVVSTYLAGENSFELIALPSAGPAFFAGWFVLIVPVILIIGAGWPTALMLWSRYATRVET